MSLEGKFERLREEFRKENVELRERIDRLEERVVKLEECTARLGEGVSMMFKFMLAFNTLILVAVIGILLKMILTP